LLIMDSPVGYRLQAWIYAWAYWAQALEPMAFGGSLALIMQFLGEWN